MWQCNPSERKAQFRKCLCCQPCFTFLYYNFYYQCAFHNWPLLRLLESFTVRTIRIQYNILNTKRTSQSWFCIRLIGFPPYTLGCNEFIFYSIFIRLTLFSLYFSILRTIYFLTFFYSRPPSFAKLTFCKFKSSK